MSKFENSSFHKEGKSGAALKKKPKILGTKGQADGGPESEFIKELVETGKANWKKAPKAVKKRYDGIFLILFSVPIIAFSTFELIRRLEGTSTKKVRQGELLENQEIRKFDEVEKWQVERDSIMYKIFGRDFFLDGFTSKTMKNEDNEKK